MTVEPEIIPMPKAVVARKEETAAPAPVSESAIGVPQLVAVLHALMTNPEMSPERVKQAFEFYKLMDGEQARKAFNAAMADARAEIPPIIKNREVDFTSQKGRTNYRHEDLAGIAKIIDPILGKHGLSYRFRTTSTPNEPICVTCIVSHRQGYSEENSLVAPRDDTGNKNSIQQIGSTITYLQRYTLKAALGLSAAQDDDGNGTSKKPENITQEQCDALIAKLDATKSDKARFCKFFGIDGVAALPAKRYQQAMSMLNQKAG